MFHKASGGLLVAMLLSGLVSTALAQTDDWQPRLVSLPTGQVRHPTTPIRIYIPPSVPVATLKQLALELDAVDVTSMVQREGDYAVVDPPQPLAWGTHRLRLVQYLPNGDIKERGSWTLEVRKTQRFREASLTADGTLNLMQRVGDHNLTDAPGRNAATGNLTLDGRVANADWQASATLPFVFDSTATGRHLDIADFLIKGRKGQLSGQAGHQTAVPDSLIASDFYRRGISATYTSVDQGQTVTGFAMRTNSVSGFEEGLGVGDANDRVDGITWTGYPVRTASHSVQLAATYLDGQGPDAGTNVGGETTVTSGRALSISADGLWLNNRLRLRGEYAGTDYDFDGTGGLAPQNDKALDVLMTYSPWSQKVVDAQPMNLNVGVERKIVGPYFRSLANPGAASDRDLTRGYVDFAWSGLDLQTSLATEDSNVDNSALLPTNRTDLASLAMTYNPLPGSDPAHPYGAWGQPSFGLNLSRQTARTLFKPTSYLGSTLNGIADVVSGSANFTHTTWNWGASYSVTATEDRTKVTPDTRVESTALNASFAVGQRLTLAPRFQYNASRDRSTNTVDNNRLAGLNLAFTLIPERLTGTLDYEVNRDSVSDDSVDNEVRTLSTSLDWTAIPPRPATPGVTLALEGTYTDTTDHITASLSSDSYQLFLKAIVGWSAAY